MTSLPAVQRFVSNTGVRIYRIPCEAFPNFIVYAYLLLEAGVPTLVDTGSGYGESNDHLFAGLDVVKDEFGEKITLEDIKRVIITHGHIDHFGGLQHVVERVSDVEVAIHGLDHRVLSSYEERVVVATKALNVYLQRAGVEPELQSSFMEMYSFSKKHVHSVRVHRTLSDGQELDGIRFIHTPGHCPGQVCLVLGDVILTADHVLSRTTPHQSPESITAYMGLGHYLESLEKVRSTGGFDLALGGHEEEIPNVYRRIDQIRASHMRKLDRVQAMIREHDGPATINDITKIMYSKVEGFHVLLALEEVGAHVEYLYQYGQLCVHNVDEVQREDNPALRYAVV